MSDVYSKQGRPDRLVDTESERTAAVFEGFKPAKAAKVEENKTETVKTEAPKSGAGNQSNTAPRA